MVAPEAQPAAQVVHSGGAVSVRPVAGGGMRLWLAAASSCADAVRAAVTGAGVRLRLRLLGHLASRPHMDRLVA